MSAFFGWIKHWARTALEASTRVEFYRRAGERKTGEAVGHLAMLAFLWTLPLSAMFFAGLRQVSIRVAEGMKSSIPPGTVFEMKDHALSNNLQEPLVFPVRDGVIIVNTASSTLTLSEGEDGLVIGATGIAQREDGRDASVDFKDVPDFRVDREGLMVQIGRWAPLTLFLGSLFVLVFMFLAFWSGVLLNALLHGFALWLLLKVIKRPRAWREAFVAELSRYARARGHAVTVVFDGADTGLADRSLPTAGWW